MTLSSSTPQKPFVLMVPQDHITNLVQVIPRASCSSFKVVDGALVMMI
jgi:hypothetical protein